MLKGQAVASALLGGCLAALGVILLILALALGPSNPFGEPFAPPLILVGVAAMVVGGLLFLPWLRLRGQKNNKGPSG